MFKKGFVALFLSGFFFLSCQEAEEKTALEQFHFFLVAKNSGKHDKVEDVLNMENDKTKAFYNKWKTFYTTTPNDKILKIKKSSCIIYNISKDTPPVISFKENFINDTCQVRLLKDNLSWKIEIISFPFSTTFAEDRS